MSTYFLKKVVTLKITFEKPEKTFRLERTEKLSFTYVNIMLIYQEYKSLSYYIIFPVVPILFTFFHRQYYYYCIANNHVQIKCSVIKVINHHVKT